MRRQCDLILNGTSDCFSVGVDQSQLNLRPLSGLDQFVRVYDFETFQPITSSPVLVDETDRRSPFRQRFGLPVSPGT